MATSAASKPSPEKIFATLTSYQQTFALKAAIELEIFTAIAEGANDAAHLAKRVAAAERGVRILADTLTIQGFLRKEGDGYLLTQDSAVFLDKRSPAYMGAMADFLTGEESIAHFSALAEAVRKGGTSSEIGDNSKPYDQRWVSFARSMGALALPMAGVLAGVVSANSAERVRILDIAAGHGMYGVVAAKTNPRVEVTAVDWPAVLEVAKENAQRAGIADRYLTRAGSALEVELGEGYDYVFITNFLHHFDIPGCEHLLRRFCGALKPGGKALIVEFVPNDDRVSPPIAAGFSLVMLANTVHGDAYTFAEYEKMCRAAGFRSCALEPVPDLPQQLIVAER